MNRILQGIPASEGMARGKVHILGSIEQIVPQRSIASNKIDMEIRRFREAIYNSQLQLENILAQSELDDDLKAIFEVQRLLLQDPMLIDESIDKIKNRLINAEAALANELEILKKSVFSSHDRQMYEHFSDVEDITNRLLSNLMGIESGDIRIQLLRELDTDSILVSDNLSPTLMLHISDIAGIALENNQIADHMVVLARSRNIPVLVELPDLLESVRNEEEVLLDAISGILVIKPDEKYLQSYVSWTRKQRSDRLSQIQSPVNTTDQHQVELWCNLGDLSSSQDIRIKGSSGVGLFRTEFLYMKDTSLFNNIHQQIELYSTILQDLGNKPVTFRLLDVSADKPFLGSSGIRDQHLYGVRFLLANPKLLQSQIRSILEASLANSVKDNQVQLMIPMLSQVEDFIKVQEYFMDIRAEIASDQDIHFDQLPKINLGVMLETPASILMLPELSEVVDFFSVGSNDLAQLVLGMPRQNQSLTDDHISFQPALYRIIQQITTQAQKNVTICGEIAARLDIIPLLLGLGVIRFSVAPAHLHSCHKLIQQLGMAECQMLAAQVLHCRYAREVHQLISSFSGRFDA